MVSRELHSCSSNHAHANPLVSLLSHLHPSVCFYSLSL